MTKMFLLFLLTGQVFSEQLKLTEVVEKAIANSEAIKMSIYDKKAAQLALKETKALRLGKLNLKTTYTNGDEPVYSFAETLRQGKFSIASMASVNNPPSIENTELAIEAGIPIFTGFAIRNYKKIGETAVKMAENYTRRTESAVRFNAAYLYLTATFKAKLLQELEHTIKSSKVELESADKLNSNGMIPGSDYYAALAIYSGLENFRNTLAGELENDLKKLAYETNTNFANFKISGKLNNPLIEQINCDIFGENIENDRADVKAYKSMVEISQIKAEVEKNSIIPQVDIFGAFYGNTSSINALRTSTLYAIRINFPVGDPSYISRKEKVLAYAKKSKQDFLAKLKAARTELSLSCSSYLTSVKGFYLAKNTLEKAENSLELFRPLYRQGKQSIMEVLRAEKSLFEAKATYYETVYKTNLFYLQTLFNAEKLDDNSLAKIEENLK